MNDSINVRCRDTVVVVTYEASEDAADDLWVCAREASDVHVDADGTVCIVPKNERDLGKKRGREWEVWCDDKLMDIRVGIDFPQAVSRMRNGIDNESIASGVDVEELTFWGHDLTSNRVGVS